MEFIVNYLAYLILFLNVTVAGYVLIKIIQRFMDTPIDSNIKSFEALIDTRYREIALITAIVSTSGSLFLSNVLGWTPCSLCWWQRIFMYPLVIIFASSIFFDNKNVSDYAVPITITGALISLYHYSVQIMSEIESGCSIGSVSCSTKYTFYFDYITIPVMALTGFIIILILSHRNWD